jgi:hypothetical protein
MFSAHIFFVTTKYRIMYEAPKTIVLGFGNGNDSFCSDLPGGEKERMDEIEQDLYGLRPGFILSQVGESIFSRVGGSILSQVGGSILSQVGGSILSQVGGSILSQVGGSFFSEVSGSILS